MKCARPDLRKPSAADRNCHRNGDKFKIGPRRPPHRKRIGPFPAGNRTEREFRGFLMQQCRAGSVAASPPTPDSIAGGRRRSIRHAAEKKHDEKSGKQETAPGATQKILQKLYHPHEPYRAQCKCAMLLLYHQT